MPTRPFGSPDGAKASLDEINESFIPFDDEDLWGGLCFDSKDFKTRVIVGRKGAGKTVYLRKQHVEALKQDTLWTDPIDYDGPDTDDIMKFSTLFNPFNLDGQWNLLWRRAIFLSAHSHLLHNDFVKEKISEEHIKKLSAHNFDGITRRKKTKVPIYSQATEIINRYTRGDAIVAYLKKPEWIEFESVISEVLQKYPPMYFFMDALDDSFQDAPMYWMHCQKGLFNTIMKLLENHVFGDKLRVVISIRDIALSSVYRGEHGSRYRDEPTIRSLIWTYDAIVHLLEKKILMLNKKGFENKKGNSSIENWIGISQIKNTRRGLNENIHDYIIRHTRLLPRDIINLGNNLWDALIRNRAKDKRDSPAAVVRRTVRNESKLFGNEQLAVCANQIASDILPTYISPNGYHNPYSGSSEYKEGQKKKLKDIISSIGTDTFTHADISAAQELATEYFGSDIKVFSVLWQNGLVGAVGKDNTLVYYDEHTLDDFNLPMHFDHYAFHSSMIDSVDLKPKSEQPYHFYNGK